MTNVERFGVKDMQNLIDNFLCDLKFLFVLRNYWYSFHLLAKVWVTFFQTFAELWVQIFNQNGTSPSKIRLSLPLSSKLIFKQPSA